MSDWQAAGLLVGQDLSTINSYLIYKGCVAHANNGQTHAAESMLNAAYQQLLLERRYLKTDLESKMIEALNFEIDLKHPRYFELMGDREHILGSHFNRQSEPANAAQHFARAHTYFQQGADAHRALRSLINQAICFSTAASHTSGELFFLKQRTNREGFHDLAGNIEKALRECLVSCRKSCRGASLEPGVIKLIQFKWLSRRSRSCVGFARNLPNISW